VTIALLVNFIQHTFKKCLNGKEHFVGSSSFQKYLRLIYTCTVWLIYTKDHILSTYVVVDTIAEVYIGIAVLQVT